MESTYEVLAVRYGTVTTRRSQVFLNYHVYGESDADIQMDYFFWIARNADRTVVIDTGYAPDIGQRRGRSLIVDPLVAMDQLGVKPGSTSVLIVTHLHYDHIGNLPAFDQAEVVMGRREASFWAGPHALRPQFRRSVEGSELKAALDLNRERLTFVDNEHQVAPGIDAIQVGGHTPGQLVVVVQSTSGQVVLASDAAHFYEEVTLDRPFAIVSDLAAMYQGYDLLRDLIAPSENVLVAGHDPEVARRFPQVADGRVYRIA